MMPQIFPSEKCALYGTLALFAVLIAVFTNPAYSQSYNVYVDPLPEWAGYASNVMYESTQAWTGANPSLRFYQVDDPRDADFRVQWVREFGVEHVGYAYGDQFIEVGLGDSHCLESWQPYSEDHIIQIMTHEIGHILGLEHTDDMNDIMYPIALHREYGTVTIEKTLTHGYAYYTPICTVRDLTSLSYHVESSDPTYGFDVYVVPSSKSFEDWAEGESFDHYSDEGCYGENYLSYGGLCESVSGEAGIMVIMGERLTDPLVTVTIQMQESLKKGVFDGVYLSAPEGQGNDNGQKNNGRTIKYSIWTDSNRGFEIEYPDDWLVINDTPGIVVIFRDPRLNSTIEIHEIDEPLKPDNLNDLRLEEKGSCDDATFEKEGYTCSGHTVTYEDVFDDSNPGYIIALKYAERLHFPESTQDTSVILYEVSDGNLAYQVYSSTRAENADEYNRILIHTMQSFKFIEEGAEPQERPPAEPVPVPSDSKAQAEEREISVMTDGTIIDLADIKSQIAIYGSITDYKKGENVALVFTDPAGTSYGYLIFPESDGSFRSYMGGERFAIPGTYEVAASVGSKLAGTFQINAINQKNPRVAADSDALHSRETHVADFPSVNHSPAYYMERYAKNPQFKAWFDGQFPGTRIENMVSYADTYLSGFPDDTREPAYYMDRYYNEHTFREWFDAQYPGMSIHDVLGISAGSAITGLLASKEMPEWAGEVEKWWSSNMIADEEYLAFIIFLAD